MKELKCHFLSKEEIQKLEKAVINPQNGGINPNIVGQSAYTIATIAGIDTPPDTKILIAELPGIGRQYPLSAEKLSPILSFYKAKDSKQGIELCDKIVRFGGLGHSAVIHSNNDDVIKEFSSVMKTGRLIINQPSSQGAIGDVYNTYMPSLTLGCGSFGHNTTTSNITAVNLINKKRVAKRTINMQWFKIPDRIYFEYGSTRYLEKMPDITRAIIVTDKVMLQNGFVDKVLYYLRNVQIMSTVRFLPKLNLIPHRNRTKRAAIINSFRPDVIIAWAEDHLLMQPKQCGCFTKTLKWILKHSPISSWISASASIKFPFSAKSQICRHTNHISTGSEVTSFAVITDKVKQIKYPIADYELTPDVAIIDPEFTLSIPPSVTADTGLDVLTHAIEAMFP
jgi:acetaldehyde dehydrogenase/alcohol dehydrogenase